MTKFTSFLQHYLKKKNFITSSLSTVPNKMRGLLSVLLFSFVFHSVDAFPSGTGGCSSGNGVPAVQGQHLETFGGSREVKTGSLDLFGYEVIVNGGVLSPGKDQKTLLEPDLDYNIGVQMNGDDQDLIKGCFIRVQTTSDEDVDDLLLFTAGDNTQVTSTCDTVSGVVGITHTSSETKSKCTGTLTGLVGSLSVVVDVTIVFNNQEASIYAHDVYQIAFESDISDDIPLAPAGEIITDPPTIAPSVVPGIDTTTGPSASSPSTAPVTSNVTVPTTAMVPVPSPVTPPSSGTTMKPVTMPVTSTMAPVMIDDDDETTKAPVKVTTTSKPVAVTAPTTTTTTSKPVVTPVTAPTTTTTSKPVVTPVTAPTTTTSKPVVTPVTAPTTSNTTNTTTTTPAATPPNVTMPASAPIVAIKPPTNTTNTTSTTTEAPVAAPVASGGIMTRSSSFVYNTMMIIVPTLFFMSTTPLLLFV